jgi:hypothetical protein
MPPTKKPRKKVEILSAPKGTSDKVKRLAAILTVRSGEPVLMRDALALAVEETLTRHERRIY